MVCFSLQHFDCRNHIRVIQPMGDGSRLYICGTYAHNPKDWVVHVSTIKMQLLITYVLHLYLWLLFFATL